MDLRHSKKDSHICKSHLEKGIPRRWCQLCRSQLVRYPQLLWIVQCGEAYWQNVFILQAVVQQFVIYVSFKHVSSSGDVWGQIMCGVTHIQWFTVNAEQELCAPSRKEASAREMFRGADRQMPGGLCVLTGLLPSCLFLCARTYH